MLNSDQGGKPGLSARDRGLLALAVVVILGAVGFIYWNVQSQMPHEVGRINVPTGSNPKVLFMKAKQNGQQGGQVSSDASSVMH
jgi:hypothetical protein